MATQDMLAKVRALLDTAESYQQQGNAEAADSYQAKAEELMAKYRINEEAVIAKDQTALLPDYRVITVFTSGVNSHEWLQTYVNLFFSIADHAGVKALYRWDTTPGQPRRIDAHVVGYETDIGYAEMLFTAARLVFADRLEPKVNPHQSDQVNAYRLRRAGIERVRIADLLWNDRSKANLAKVGRMYKSECAARNEEPLLTGRGVTGAAYREQYAQQFVTTMYARLYRLRLGTASQGGLELFGRKERVQEAFYTRFPEERPQKALGEASPCPHCTADKLCKVHKPKAPTAADKRAAERYYTEAAIRGREAGLAAAHHVDLGRGAKEQVADGGRGDVERMVRELS